MCEMRCKCSAVGLTAQYAVPDNAPETGPDSAHAARAASNGSVSMPERQGGPAAATHFEEAVIPNRNEVLLHAHVPHATLTPSSMSCLQCPHSVAESPGAPRSEGPNVASQFGATQPVDIDRGALRQVCAFDVTHRDS